MARSQRDNPQRQSGTSRGRCDSIRGEAGSGRVRPEPVVDSLDGDAARVARGWVAATRDSDSTNTHKVRPARSQSTPSPVTVVEDEGPSIRTADVIRQDEGVVRPSVDVSIEPGLSRNMAASRFLPAEGPARPDPPVYLLGQLRYRFFEPSALQ